MPSPSKLRTSSFASVVYAFTAVMLGTTLPTPMYALYSGELGFSVATTTVVFATYAAGVLTALIGFGRWSDAVGRRPMLLAGLACAAASSLAFLTVTSVWQLLFARALSGLSAGIFTGTATATIVETASPAWKTRAMVVATTANIGGLALGPTLSGVLVQYGPAPLRLVFGLHLVLLAIAGLGLVRTSETTTAQPRLRPTLATLSIPIEARHVFPRAALAAFAGFCVLGFFTAMAPTFLNHTLGIHNQALTGALVSTVFLASAAAQILTRTNTFTNALELGCAGVVVGMLLIVTALATESVLALITGAVVAGAGQGASFVEGLGAVVDITPPPRRGEVASVYFVVAYIAISAPVVGMGFTAQYWSLSLAGITFSAIVAGLATLALVSSILATPHDSPNG